MSHTPALMELHSYVHPNQILKLNEMDRLMFDSWRKGYKRNKIAELAQEIEPGTTEKDVGVYFKVMFVRELSPDAIYLNKKPQKDQAS